MEWVVMGLIISKQLVWEKRPRYPNPKTAPVEDIIRLGQEFMTSWELVRLVPSHKTQSLVHSKKIHETWLKRTCLLPRAWRTAHPSFKNVNMEFHFTNSFSIDHLIKKSFAAYGVALQLINEKHKNEKLSKTKLSQNQASPGHRRPEHFLWPVEACWKWNSLNDLTAWFACRGCFVGTVTSVLNHDCSPETGNRTFLQRLRRRQ